MISCFAQCGCCAKCRPRYQRLVDNIYPVNPAAGLVSSNMQKLTFYAVTHPEKLDRIGEYLAYWLGRDVGRERIFSAKIAVEAMDKLLTACHGSPSLNLFVESFLKMVQRLLETNNSELQTMATESFVNFSNIQEDTPSYHRRYDFFISKFSSMCHSNATDLNMRRQLRVAGLKGLRGVVRKTVSDDLQANIWEQPHMDKIVPSLLFNMSDDLPIADSVDADNTEDIPRLLADSCLRELMAKVSYGNMKSVLQPLQNHFDAHNLWVPSDFAVSCFRLIMYSIQSQYSYVVIQSLMAHLDKHMQADPNIRNGMATVLSGIVVIAAMASNFGPGILDIFNNLLRHLRHSVDREFSAGKNSSEQDEKRYQETLINTIGEFANNLPDFEKVQIMMFIIGKVPLSVSEKKSDVVLQHVLVRTLLKVATKYKTGQLATALSSSFLDQLLQLSLVDDRSVRLLVQQILHTLLDRHDNIKQLEHLDYVPDISTLGLAVEKCSRTDSMFMKKNGPALTSALYKSAQKLNNIGDNYDAILCTMALLCVEVGSEETLVELFRLALGLQTFASDLDSSELSLGHRAALQNMVARYMNVSSQLMAIPALCQHIDDVIKKRSECLPALNLFQEGGPLMARFSEDILLTEGLAFHRDTIVEALHSSGNDASRLNLPFVTRPTTDALRSPNDIDNKSVATGGSGGVDSTDSTFRPQTFRDDGKKVTFETLKEIANTPAEKLRQEEAEMAKKLAEMYRTVPFEELVRRNRERSTDISSTLSKILERVKEREAIFKTEELKKPQSAHEIQFPDLFVY